MTDPNDAEFPSEFPKEFHMGNRGKYGRVLRVVLLTLALCAAVAPAAFAQDPLVTGAGDIACDDDSSNFNGGLGTGSGTGTSAFCKQRATSNLLSDANVVFTLGDNQYEHGSLSNFMQSYDKSWGRYKSKTRPAIGNHEYGTTASCEPTGCPSSYYKGEQGYFDYFNGVGNATGPAGPRPTRPANQGPSPHAYYSYNVGTWHLIALNSMCYAVGGCHAGSPQEQWLREDLSANRDKKCVLAYWHHPPFSSGLSQGYPTLYDPFWKALHEYRADVVMVGHDHVYERFHRQSASGSATTTGPRQFMVGTGGKNVSSFPKIQPNSAKRIREHGVLRLRLMNGSYRWAFTRISDGKFLDLDTASCVDGPVPEDQTPPAAPNDLSASPGAGKVDLDWANNSEGDLAGYNVYRKTSEGSYTKINGSLLTASAYTDSSVTGGTAYTYSVKAVDKAGNEGPASNEVSATPSTSSEPPATSSYRDTVFGTSGLVSYWRVGESSGTSAADEKGSNPGVYSGGVSLGQAGALTSDSNTAAGFDGSDDRVDLPSIALANRSFTVEGWIRAADLAASRTWFGAHSASAASQSVHLRARADGSLRFGYYSNDLDTPPGLIKAATWHHVAFSYNAGTDTSKVYVDGVARASGSQGPFAGVDPQLRIGAWRAGREQWKGLIDEVAVYHSAVSDAEVAEHYQAGKG